MQRRGYFFLTAFFLGLGMVSSSRPVNADDPLGEFIQIRSYKPMYFLIGDPYSKVQVSLRLRVIEGLPIYFGYSQLMMWDIFGPSAFFHDVNYMPEAFYRLEAADKTWFDFSPWSHESNGKGGAEERSWNLAYVRYQQSVPMGEEAQFTWSFKLNLPYAYKKYNPDLPDYRGIWELEVGAQQIFGPFFDKSDVSLRLVAGGETAINPLQGSQELTVRMKAAYRKVLPLFVVQLFHGYAESLIDYREKRTALRAGFGF